MFVLTNGEAYKGPLIQEPKQVGDRPFPDVTSKSAQIAYAAREAAQEMLRISKSTGCLGVNLLGGCKISL
jgi:hypothetical protein